MSRKRQRSSGAFKDDGDYFALYSSVDIHEEMLLDESRTIAYQNAIQHCHDRFQAKIVLDVGCGLSCVLTLFALKAGAAHVFAIDAADGLLQVADQVLRDNKVRDRVTLINERVEDVKSLPGVDTVDIIISEWMGYALLFESMLESVLIARDRFLRPGGLIFPCKARLHVAPFSGTTFIEETLTPWQLPMYGVDLSALYRLIAERLDDAQIMSLNQEDIIGQSFCLRTIDLTTQPANRHHIQQIQTTFDLQITTRDIFHGLCLWFDVEFPNGSVRLGTSPDDPETHWKQTVFFLDSQGWRVDQSDHVRGVVRIGPNSESHRLLDIAFDINLVRSSVTPDIHIEKCYTLC